MIATADREDAAQHGLDRRSDLEILETFLGELKECGAQLPIGRPGSQNKLQIARQAGVNRNIFYVTREADNLISRF